MSTNPTTSRFTLRSTAPGVYALTPNGQKVADCVAVSVVVDAGDIARVRLDLMPWEIDIDIDAEIEENHPVSMLHHVRTDPRCAYHRPPRTWLGRWRFDRNRGRACPACEGKP